MSAFILVHQYSFFISWYILSEPGCTEYFDLWDSCNISNYGSDVISEVPHSETYLNEMENQSVLAMQDFKQPLPVDITDNEIH
ncbi:hypothetical protein Tco_0303234, partial [Tanacetum coccineum]